METPVSYTAADVKKLRELTGAGMMSCKTALVDAEGDFEKATDLVRERTGAKMDARATERTAADGIVHCYMHVTTPDVPAKVGVMIQLDCETDFVAKTADFQQLAQDLCLHITAMRPIAVSVDQVDPAFIDKEKDFARKEAEEAGKPADLVERIVEGKVKKVYEELVLLNQKFVKDDSKTVEKHISELQAKMGEKIQVAKFVRFSVAG
ncbi:MAG: elongation factor Ts [Glaciecola sp.]|jgi:elongation factor Ts